MTQETPQEDIGFAALGLAPQIVEAITVLGYEEPTPIQRETIPPLIQGRDLLALPPAEMRAIRGKEISMIFQEPMTSLNPVYTCGEQILEAIVLHENVDRREAKERAIDMLRKVGIPSPEQRVNEYPHQMSGGMRQRVMIAMALACRPKILIADEPTTALDVTIQAQILELLKSLQHELGMAVLLITHYQRLLDYVKPDFVHVLADGRIVRSGGADLAHELEREGYAQVAA